MINEEITKKSIEKKKDVTIVVSSCDLYEDAWKPFFRLLKIQWSECPYEILLNTETKKYICDDFKIKSICTGKNVAWSERMIKCLEQVDTEFVLFFLEDQFLREPVNTEWFNNTLEYMKKNNEIGVIFLHHTGKQKNSVSEPYFERDSITDKFRIVGLAALYRKKYFLKLLRKHESPWEFEKFASIRSKRYKEKVLQYSKDYPKMLVYDDKIEKGYGITQRKWLPKNKELFEKYNIEVNFNNLGMFEEVTHIEKSSSEIDQNEIRERLYNVKKTIKKVPYKVRRSFRIIKSLI